MDVAVNTISTVRRTYWLPALLGLLCVSTGGLQEAAVCGQTPSLHQPAESTGKLLYQEVVVAQKSAFRVQGLDSCIDLRYRVLSSLAINERNGGTLDVEQKIVAAKLLHADEGSQEVFSNLLQKLTGTKFTLSFGPDGELTRFDGAKDKPQAVGGPAIDQAILLASLIDQDGWKEIARYSFFQPHKPVRSGSRWEKSMTHSWGFLGYWTGHVFFRYAGQQGGLQRFPYTFKLTYVPPKPEARGMLLPISKASFKHGEAGGTIYFDSGKRRVSHVEELFHVKGQMSIELLGQNLPVELDEEQRFQIRLLEQDPRLQEAVDQGSHRLPGVESTGQKAKKQRVPKSASETD